MELWARFWVLVTHILRFTTLSAYEGSDQSQSPIAAGVPAEHLEPAFVPPVAADHDGPIFRPPGHRTDKGDGSDFKCNYTAMKGYRNCSTPLDRSCWLFNPETGDRFDINTDYETRAPTGVEREYWLDVTKSDIPNADGYPFIGATLFNETYPGPWIQACWGDTVKIHVRNTNPDRGTSIHWHGIRQLNSMQMDGVNGVTQCPIATGRNFTYEWKAMQYGSSWYHSHYSEQYADGTLGPITLHGPSSGNYDEAADIPLLMTDFRHASVFDRSNSNYSITSILLNGKGNVTQFDGQKKEEGLDIPTPYTLVFEKTVPRPKRYLLRLINTSIDSTFVFSIDNHLLSIVSADFVPIYPYLNTSVLIGIGQRYNVIVEAAPRANGTTQRRQDDGNYWIRTWLASCRPPPTDSSSYMQTGILRYNSKSTDNPKSFPWDKISTACSDETYTSLRPVLPWIVEPPINNVSTTPYLQHVSVMLNPGTGGFKDSFLAFRNDTGPNPGYTPLQIDFTNPTFNNLENTGTWKELWEVFPEGRSDKVDWVWLAITVSTAAGGDTDAHPIHLHGHDFAILQQSEQTVYSENNLRLNLLNPPRRDVVLLPASGFIVIAFKADNPGSWLLHCHIAAHASGGLALQILERQADAASMWPSKSPARTSASSLCSGWESWMATSYAPTASPTTLPTDSGI
ncbi:putative laccase [Echria macrotheca]|uniref:Laccase n=1 Tax=Echria macrotheca TaxID=438768 RepID=A0AAJ0B722_9PEZI|nr:putative laccase [Echria macrotheca]